MKKPKLIYIEWSDAIANAVWRSEEEAEEWANDAKWHIKSVGWLIKETDEYIALALSEKEEDDYSVKQYANLQKIPKTWIKNRIDLTKHIKQTPPTARKGS